VLENTICTPNLFGGKRLVLCEDFFDAEKGAKAMECVFPRLAENAENCTVMILAPSLDKRTKWAKWVLENAKVETFEPLEGVSLFNYLEQQAKRWGGGLPRTCAQKLFNRCGDDLWVLTSELQKLIHAAEDGVVQEDMIDTMTRRHPKLEIWDFLEAVSRQDASRAFRLLRDLITTGVSAHEILAMVMREVRIHALLSSCMAEGLSSPQIATATGLHPYVIQKTLPLSRRFTPAQIERMYDALFEIDKKLKTGGISMTTDDTGELELAIEKFVVSLGGTKSPLDTNPSGI